MYTKDPCEIYKDAQKERSTILVNMFLDFIIKASKAIQNYFVKSDQELRDKYFSESQDIFELERRIRQYERQGIKSY